MGLKVCKFGGTSMADAKAIRQVKNIISNNEKYIQSNYNYVIIIKELSFESSFLLFN